MMIRALSTALVLSLTACASTPFLKSVREPALKTPKPDIATLSLERLEASPSLSGPSPRLVKYSPDGSRVSFLKAREEDAARFDLWAFDVATGEASMLVDSKWLEPDDVALSEEEKALRERKRIAGSKGIVSYDWGGADHILVPLGGDLYLVTLGDNDPQTRRLTETEAFEYDARVSPAGKYVSFIRDGAVYAIELETNEERRLTPLAEPEKAISYGVAEFVAQEEMSRYTGYWWSPDDQYIAYTKVDESTVDIIPRFDIAADNVTIIEQRYPRAGRPNAIVDLFLKDLASDEPVELLSVGPDTYLAHAEWIDPESLLAHHVDRDQTLVTSSLFSPDGTRTDQDELAERQPNWINLGHDGMHRTELDDEDALIFSSERSGYRHIWQVGSDGTALALTSGNWAVSTVQAVTPSAVFFTGFKDTPLEKHLYSIPALLDDEDLEESGAKRLPGRNCIDLTPMAARVTASCAEPTRITELGKSWSVTVAPDGKSFVGTSSGPNTPPQTGLYNIDGTLITWIEENALDENHPYAPYLPLHTVPEFGTIEAEDGQEMYYSLQLPPHFDETKKYPVILEVYGGPGVQRVTRNWEKPVDQFYVQQGYILFRLDNRGSANRGKKFEDVIYRSMGIPEVRDQLRGVEFLRSLPYVDGDRIAIQGWSYGGYMALMTALQAPRGTFAAAVSGAPVTDWALYDTFYTERYMDTPQENPEGYEKGSVFYHLDRREGGVPPLLLIHGMADDNVIFDNSTRLMAEMQEKGIVFDLMTYPGQRHGIRGQALSTHLMKTRMAFLDRHLMTEDTD